MASWSPIHSISNFFCAWTVNFSISGLQFPSLYQSQVWNSEGIVDGVFNVPSMQGKVPEECWSIPQQKRQHEAKHCSQLHSIWKLHDHFRSRGREVYTCLRNEHIPSFLSWIALFWFACPPSIKTRFPLFGKKYQLKFAHDISAETHCLVHFPSLIRLTPFFITCHEFTFIINCFN